MAQQADGTTESILAERQKTHGEYREHARCTQAIMRAITTERNWEHLSDIQKESLHMFAHKMGRIATGNPDIQDHWDDIAGYAVLVSQRLGETTFGPGTPEDGGHHHASPLDPKGDGSFTGPDGA